MKNYKSQIALIAALAVSMGVSMCSDSLDAYALDVMLNVGINIILAVSLNLVNGFTGQFSLGHAAFMAVGAYGASIVTLEMGGPLVRVFGGPGWFADSLTFLIALTVGGVCAAVAGWLVGVPSLRLRGDYLAIVTLGFNEIIRVVLQNTSGDGPFGGALGLKGIEPFTSFFWVFAIAAVAIYVIAALVNSTYGRGFLAVRDDEIAAESMGVNTVRYKVIAFVIGSFFAGLAGGLYAHLRTTISPEGFNFLKSVDVVVMVILGGMGSTVGVVLAAVILTVLNEFLRDFEQYRMIVFSLLLIVMMIMRPQGLLPAEFFARRRKSA
ncbi:MAG: branched-chain amino acid ABC transporter permease [Verrucomicrobiaceae bacterium]|nr:branched-chain amino acid ABC transporter permease [Verrucomicrobiaceae bacterium]